MQKPKVADSREYNPGSYLLPPEKYKTKSSKSYTFPSVPLVTRVTEKLRAIPPLKDMRSTSGTHEKYKVFLYNVASELVKA